MIITIDISADELKSFVESFAPHHNHCNHNNNHHCTHVSAPALIETARKLDKAIEEAKPQPEPQTAPAPAKQKKQRTGNLADYTPKQAGPKTDPKTEPQQTSVKAPSCVDVWTLAELNLLRTCKTVEDANFVYDSHFPGKRSQNAVRQKWYKIEKAGTLISPGKATVIGGTLKCASTGIIQSITDDRQYGNITFDSDPATYQIGIEKLERAE